MTDLRQAAKAVVDRWDTPAWEWRDQGPTADLMADLRKALAQPEQPEQKPVAWAVFEGWNAHDLYLPQEYDEALKMAGYKGDHAEVKPLYTTPPAAPVQPVQPVQPEPKHYRHTWGQDGERCVVCGDKDWMGTSCKKISAPAAPVQEPRHIVQSNGRHSHLLTHMMNSRNTPPAAAPVQRTEQEPVACRTLCELCIKRGYNFCANAAKTTPITTTPPAAQPAPVQEPVAWAKFLHYPECWDTAAYPTLHDAVHEALAWAGCSVCAPPATPVQEPVAWRWRSEGYSDWPKWSVSVKLPWPAWQDGKAQRRGVECEPLYTTTPPAAQRQCVTFPTMLRKMWSGGEVQAWLDENVNKEKNT